MASQQLSRRGINEKHRAAIMEMKKELAAMAPVGVMVPGRGGGGIRPKSQATAKAGILNEAMGRIKFQDSKNWSGNVLGKYPPTIDMDRSAKFTHRGVPPSDSNGSYGAVIYVGPNVQGGSDDCAYVLAWKVLGDGSENKVYVETGDSSKFPKGNIKWDGIKASLDNSTNDAYYYDDDVKAEASACVDKSGNNVAIAAVFDVAN